MTTATPAAVASAERHRQRLRASASSVGSALASRLGLIALAGALSLVTTPLLLGSLGVEGYGAYALIVAIPALLPFLDAGLGAPVTGFVAAATGAGDLRGATREISAAFVLLAFAGLLLGAATFACFFLVDWGSLLGLNTVPADAVQLSVTVVLLCFAVGLPLSLAVRILVGLSKSHVGTLLGGVVAAVIAVAGIAAAAFLDAPLWCFVAVSAVSTLLGAVACVAWVRRRYPGVIRLSRDAVDAALLKRAAGTAAPFTVMAIATTVAYETDMLVVSHRLGETAVAEYAVALKYVNLVYPAIVAAGFALWPLLVQAATPGREDLRLVVARWTLVFGLGGLITAAMLVAAAPWFIDLWTGGRVESSWDLISARAVFLFLSAVHYPASMAALALGRSRMQAATLGVMALANLPLSIVLADAIGVSGPVWSSCICFGALHAAPLLWITLSGRASEKERRS
jgi:O-antigen/teichoic acid export membrane protein